jgi:hypothetical protein
LSLDPLAAEFPSLSDYVYVAGNPIAYIDPDGKDYILAIDHKNKTITIIAYYPKQTIGENKPNASFQNKAVDEGISFWNSQSGKFSYEDKYGNRYKINFNLKSKKEGVLEEQTDEVKKDYKNAKEKGFIIPLNNLNIVPDGKLAKIQGKTEKDGDILGSVIQNVIYIEESAKENKKVARHEFGHTLGMKHSSKFSILSAKYGSLTDEVIKDNIKSLLGRAGIGPQKNLQTSKKEEALGVGNVVHLHGDKKTVSPHNFENGKKIKKNED